MGDFEKSPPLAGQVNLSVMASLCPDQFNVRRQHPALGRLTDEGPGPPSISRTTDVVVPSSIALMVSGRIGCCGSRETQRILFVTPIEAQALLSTYGQRRLGSRGPTV
ncbi:hypothetical protein ACWCSH_40070 [Streptosporangium sp. NPDC001682]